jgi:hypothetical protein
MSGTQRGGRRSDWSMHVSKPPKGLGHFICVAGFDTRFLERLKFIDKRLRFGPVCGMETKLKRCA